MDTGDAPQPGLPEQEFLTVKQTAVYLNISAAIVYRHCETKKLAHYRFGEGAGAIRINRNELLEFVKRCRVEEIDDKARPEVPHQSAPYVFKHLRFDVPPAHPCGAMTKAGTPCTLLTNEDRCHLHRRSQDCGKSS